MTCYIQVHVGVNVTLDTILGIEDILISWFLIILVLLDVALLFVCCLIHCKHLCLSDVMSINSLTYLLTYLCSRLLPRRLKCSLNETISGVLRNCCHSQRRNLKLYYGL